MLNIWRPHSIHASWQLYVMIDIPVMILNTGESYHGIPAAWDLMRQPLSWNSSCSYEQHWWREGHHRKRELFSPSRNLFQSVRLEHHWGLYGQMLEDKPKDHKGAVILSETPLRIMGKMKRERKMFVHCYFNLLLFLNEWSKSTYVSKVWTGWLHGTEMLAAQNSHQCHHKPVEKKRIEKTYFFIEKKKDLTLSAFSFLLTKNMLWTVKYCLWRKYTW